MITLGKDGMNEIYRGFVMSSEGCEVNCSAQHDKDSDDKGYTRNSTTVAPPPPSFCPGSATDSTCGCACKA